jgi:hypothetical protein
VILLLRNKLGIAQRHRKLRRGACTTDSYVVASSCCQEAQSIDGDEVNTPAEQPIVTRG